MKKNQEFKIGDEVAWTSQAGGYSTRKTGRIVEIVAAGRPPSKYVSTGMRSHESYVVEVTKRSKARKPATATTTTSTYWPVRSKLSAVKPRRDKAAVAIDTNTGAPWGDEIPAVPSTTLSAETATQFLDIDGVAVTDPEGDPGVGDPDTEEDENSDGDGDDRNGDENISEEKLVSDLPAPFHMTVDLDLVSPDREADVAKPLKIDLIDDEDQDDLIDDEDQDDLEEI